MGKVAEMNKKKKKERPSLSSLQNCSPKQQQQQQQQPKRILSHNNLKINPSPTRRSTRRNPNPDGLLPSPELIDDDEEDERKERKHKLVCGLPLALDHQPHQNSSLSLKSSSLNLVPHGSDSNAGGEDPEVCNNKKRKINAVGGSAEMGEKVPKATDTPQGVGVESGPMTLLPEKKLLVFILDKLQKKDTYGVFSEPVDPEELPDYHEIIEHPIDFRTVRERLDGGVYANLEQFERDVFLICTNAMEYNEPDTIYFRQARSIQELAKKDFGILRQDSDDSEPQPKVVRRGRPPSKNLKKFLCRSPLERWGTEISSDAAVVKLAKASRGSFNNESYTGLSSKWENEFPVSVLKGGTVRYSRKDLSSDENRRDTYQHLFAPGNHLSHLATIDGNMRQLLAVGLHSEHGYARSLASFAADLGTIVWKIASEKIGQVLPIGLNYGPGWVGEKERKHQPHSSSIKHGSVNNLVFDDHLNKPPLPSDHGSNFVAVNRSILPIKDDMVEAESVSILNSQHNLSLSRSVVRGRPESTFQIQQKPVIQIHADTNASSGVGGFDLSSGMVTEKGVMPSHLLGIVPSHNSTFASPISGHYLKSDKPEPSESAARIYTGNSLAFSPEYLPHHNRHRLVPFPPDLNVRFRSPSSPTSSLQIGSPHQPDLALQL